MTKRKGKSNAGDTGRKLEENTVNCCTFTEVWLPTTHSVQVPLGLLVLPVPEPLRGVHVGGFDHGVTGGKASHFVLTAGHSVEMHRLTAAAAAANT